MAELYDKRTQRHQARMVGGRDGGRFVSMMASEIGKVSLARDCIVWLYFSNPLDQHLQDFMEELQHNLVSPLVLLLRLVIL